MPPKTYFIADTHFDHTNIIRYCNRPFSSKEEMNQAMLNNWNRVVDPEDTVFHLGDLAYGRHRRTNTWWVSQLNGKIILIKGNHDHVRETRGLEAYEQYFLTAGSKDLILTHYPNWGPERIIWNIHGHHHNNSPSEYPLVNRTQMRINVSVELINYTPISLERILQLIGA